jgi:hypothetical protein
MGSTFETVSVDSQRTVASRSSHEVVSGVPDNEANMIFSSKVDTRFDVALLLGKDDVSRKVAQGAWLFGVIGW